MIDINLAGKLKKSREKVTIERKPPNPRMMIILGSVMILSLAFFFFGDALLGMFIPEPEFKPISIQRPPVQQPAPAVQDTQVAEQPEVIPEPVEETPAPEVDWDYGISMQHLSAYVQFTRTLPQHIDYKVITVSGDRIIAELVSGTGSQDISGVRQEIDSSLPMYNFTYTPGSSDLQVWGNLKADAGLPGGSPGADYAQAEANVDGLSSLAKEHNISFRAQDLTGPIARGGNTVLPGWIKLQGTEANMARYLERLNQERMSLNILRITGSPGSGNRNDGRIVQVYFQFELII